MDQLARLEENFITNLKPSIKIAFESSRPCCSPCWNLSPINHVEDELARDLGPTNDFYLGSTSPTLSYNLTSGPALVLALISTPLPAPAPALPSSNKLFKQFIKAYLESNQGLKQPPAEREQSFKAKVVDIYYRKLHIDCYHFCQQCKDHFETAEATGANWTLFAASFLCENISVRWT